jgi:hypothetical protein
VNDNEEIDMIYCAASAYYLKYGEVAPIFDSPQDLPKQADMYKSRLMIAVKRYLDYPHIDCDAAEVALALDVDEQQLYDAIQVQKEHYRWLDSLTGY